MGFFSPRSLRIVASSWLWFCLLLSTCCHGSDDHQSSPTASEGDLTLWLVEVGSDFVVIEWNGGTNSNTCIARYGLLTPGHHHQEGEDDDDRWWRFEQKQVVVLDHFVPSSKSFELKPLVADTSYVFEIKCKRGADDDRWLKSKPIFFTTAANSISRHQAAERRRWLPPPVEVTISPSRFRAFAPSVQPTLSNGARQWDDEPSRWTTKWTSSSSERRFTSPYASYSISLGIVSGLIGFLIINISIVQLLRYRNRQLRIRQLRFIYGDSAERFYDVT